MSVGEPVDGRNEELGSDGDEDGDNNQQDQSGPLVELRLLLLFLLVVVLFNLSGSTSTLGRTEGATISQAVDATSLTSDLTVLHCTFAVEVLMGEKLEGEVQEVCGRDT